MGWLSGRTGLPMRGNPLWRFEPRRSAPALRPRFQEGGDAFLSVRLAAVLKGMVAFEALAVSLQGLAKSHLAASHGFVGFGAVAFLFVEVAQAKLRHANAVGLAGFPNELAPHSDSGIVVTLLN